MEAPSEQTIPITEIPDRERTRAESIFKVIMKLPKWEKHGYPDS